MRFKGEQVWVRADETGQLVLDAEGRAEMKYRETDTKSYRPSPGNLIPDQGGAPSAPPAPRKPRAGGPSTKALVKAPVKALARTPSARRRRTRAVDSSGTRRGRWRGRRT